MGSKVLLEQSPAEPQYPISVFGTKRSSCGICFPLYPHLKLRHLTIEDTSTSTTGDSSWRNIYASATGSSSVKNTQVDSTRARILVVDDESETAKAHALQLEALGYRTTIELDPTKVSAILQKYTDIDLVVLDIRMPQRNGLEVLRDIKLIRPQTGVIIATVINDVEEAVRATRLGAYNYLLKPLQSERLHRVVQSFFNNRPQPLLGDVRFGSFVTQSRLCEEVFRRIEAFSQTDAPVLIQGETGTGKEVVAHLLHSIGPRNGKPFIAVNVAALSPQLFESELFGHKKGAFTGAISDTPGYFRLAQDGTLFLDEIGELGLDQQKKLLRVLETRTFSPVGQASEIPLKARVLCATNRNLSVDAHREIFRSDLYYRLNAHTIALPPLRARPEDITLLAGYFLERYCSQYGRHLLGFASEALEVLRSYAFPGNVRELDGLISAAVLLERSSFIQASTFPLHVRMVKERLPTNSSDLKEAKEHTILKVLAECGGNQTRASERLGIARGTLNRLLKELRTSGKIEEGE